jgi:hypothetical protein
MKNSTAMLAALFGVPAFLAVWARSIETVQAM